ncbi:MAG: peptidoglycan editing factor PgeF [Clostridiales bacterium]|nr:peptidoglycan editing factor PgeF [Clostridiales bacterium]
MLEQMKGFGRGALYLDVFKEFNGVKAFFSTKEGACEGNPYRNEGIFKSLGLDKMTAVRPVQVHKDNVEVIGDRQLRDAAENALREIILPDRDGMITDKADVLLTTVHADCIPVYFYDSVRKAIGLVHSGWRGTAMGIASTAILKMMEEYGCRPEDIQVFIGPGISRCCFETGAEVYEEFKSKWSFIDNFADIKISDFGIGKEAKYYIDLKGIISRQLIAIGLDKGNIQVSEHCTSCEDDLFVSYRREGGTRMRMGAGIAMTAREFTSEIF